MAKRPELERDARQFAAEITSLINSTVGHGIRLGAALTQSRAACIVGYGVTQRNQEVQRIPCTLGAAPATCWLYAAHAFVLDAVGHLTSASTSYAVYADDDPDSEPLVHYDYNRNPSNSYPEAHVQVVADSSVFRTLRKNCGLDEGTQLGHLHFPVGGRRFRPSLEDVIEFLIVEGFAEGRPDWKIAVEQSRRNFYEKQLRAAIRREKELVLEAVRDLDATDGWL